MKFNTEDFDLLHNRIIDYTGQGNECFVAAYLARELVMHKAPTSNGNWLDALQNYCVIHKLLYKKDNGRISFRSVIKNQEKQGFGFYDN